jgi:hypothetical protein
MDMTATEHLLMNANGPRTRRTHVTAIEHIGTSGRKPGMAETPLPKAP